MIEKKRLILRHFEVNETDIQALFSIFSDETVNNYLPWYPLETKDQAIEFYHKHILPKYEEEKGYYFAICLKENNTPIGYVAVSGEDSHDFGYGLRQEFWGQGIVTEASEAVLHFLKSTNIKFITATHDIYNVGSGKVMQKIGLDYKYTYRELWQPKNKVVTFRMYQLNFDNKQDSVYMEYWNKYPEHFIEDLD
ncbi:GNAT family N-acetyltransferase [Carnobacterium divergens]|uniref:GNAT family N-acetyltransferase n=1 Tax=Carnobacterium divergens TaxID=2748 RepID=UPI002890183E|nr:GNAT family N-acetyltransferase [Carnobacterium divergens]MDT2012429.1 GNAT family N-acetyltransferase [Carnobacterium divergens]